MKVTVIPVVIGELGTTSKDISEGTGRQENRRTSGDHPYKGIIKISLNIEENCGGLRRLDVTQTPVKDHWLALV